MGWDADSDGRRVGSRGDMLVRWVWVFAVVMLYFVYAAIHTLPGSLCLPLGKSSLATLPHSRTVRVACRHVAQTWPGHSDWSRNAHVVPAEPMGLSWEGGREEGKPGAVAATVPPRGRLEEKMEKEPEKQEREQVGDSM